MKFVLFESTTISKLKHLTSFLQFLLLSNNLIPKTKLESNLLAEGIQHVNCCKFVGDGMNTMMLHSPFHHVIVVIIVVSQLRNLDNSFLGRLDRLSTVARTAWAFTGAPTAGSCGALPGLPGTAVDTVSRPRAPCPTCLAWPPVPLLGWPAISRKVCVTSEINHSLKLVSKPIHR